MTQPTPTTANGIAETIAILISQKTSTLPTQPTPELNQPTAQTTQLPPRPNVEELQVNSNSLNDANTNFEVPPSNSRPSSLNALSVQPDSITVTTNVENSTPDVFNVYRY